jgi:hypothetical protein
MDSFSAIRLEIDSYSQFSVIKVVNDHNPSPVKRKEFSQWSTITYSFKVIFLNLLYTVYKLSEISYDPLVPWSGLHIGHFPLLRYVCISSLYH